MNDASRCDRLRCLHPSPRPEPRQQLQQPSPSRVVAHEVENNPLARSKTPCRNSYAQSWNQTQRATQRCNLKMSTEHQQDNAAAAGDFMEQLDKMASAEPLDAESDLIIRMNAVSKVRGGSKKERKSSLSPSKKGGIGKKPSRKSKRDGGLQARVVPRNVATTSGADMEMR